MSIYIALFNIVQTILTIYGYLLIASAVISWIPDLAQTQLGSMLTRLTEPYLGLFRRFIPPLRLGGVMLDISFLVAVIVYFFIEQGVMSILLNVIRGIGF